MRGPKTAIRIEPRKSRQMEERMIIRKNARKKSVPIWPTVIRDAVIKRVSKMTSGV
jgi:hypothetical protein